MGTNASGQRNQSWVDFAGVMLAIAGFFQMIYGAAVLNDSSYLINKILYGNMESWGWAYLITGLALLAGLVPGTMRRIVDICILVVIGRLARASLHRRRARRSPRPVVPRSPHGRNSEPPPR